MMKNTNIGICKGYQYAIAERKVTGMTCLPESLAEIAYYSPPRIRG